MNAGMKVEMELVAEAKLDGAQTREELRKALYEAGYLHLVETQDGYEVHRVKKPVLYMTHLEN